MKALLVFLAACSGVPADLALDEPLRAPAATFVDAPFPSGSDSGPAITIVETEGQVVRLGQAVKRVRGRASVDAAAVAIAFDGESRGHWVAPLGPPDPTANDELTWSFDASLGYYLPLGPGAIDVVALDANGRAGQPQRVDVCVRADKLDSTAACSDLAPPDSVLSLSWDGPADLDLQVRTPDGLLVDASHPTTISHAPPITNAELATAGVLDRDANANCRFDGAPRESLVWNARPAGGTYLVYANLNDACGTAAVSFRAVLYQTDGTRLVEVARRDGRLTSVAANGGRTLGLFVMQVAL